MLRAEKVCLQSIVPLLDALKTPLSATAEVPDKPSADEKVVTSCAVSFVTDDVTLVPVPDFLFISVINAVWVGSKDVVPVPMAM